jgi:glycosyltransferase involved in cell wall biosynthesis
VSERVSIVVPVYNEATLLTRFQGALEEAMAPTGCDWDVLYVDDGSNDDTPALLEQLRASHANIGVLRLSRNFGKEVALSAGLDHAEGDAVVIIDADLQDPPALIPRFIESWREGFDVVYGRRSQRAGETWFKTTSASVFYRLLKRVSDVDIPRDVGDFRLLSRRAVEALKTLPERHRYMKGLYAWIGFRQLAVDYDRAPRAGGSSKWSYWRLWNLALEGLTSFSAAPLKLFTWLGLAAALIAFLLGTYILLHALVVGNPIPGYPSLMVMILFLGGIQLIGIGMIGRRPRPPADQLPTLPDPSWVVV